MPSTSTKYTHHWYFKLKGSGFYFERLNRMCPVMTSANFTDTHSLQVRIPKCNNRSKSAACSLQGPTPNYSETLWKTELLGNVNLSCSDSVPAGLFWEGGLRGRTVCCACVCLRARVRLENQTVAGC